MPLFGKGKYTLVKLVKKKDIPHGLWTKCPDCGELIYNKALKEGLTVCQKCNYHFTLSAQERITLLIDKGSFEELESQIRPVDPLDFKGPKDYKHKLVEEKKKTNLFDACIVGVGRINKKKLVFAVTDSRFMMGSMGSVVGEKLTRVIELATKSKLPLV
ncbi:MAG: acetyl-CoA carboxylase carboxyl transferase subunit beta, partial [Omnitrophica bacterium]|nr:acetyl-CoA carboxylase carboxyl transferase subunit beta [Candidatus Omnitrophota bacterium]